MQQFCLGVGFWHTYQVLKMSQTCDCLEWDREVTICYYEYDGGPQCHNLQ